MSEVNPPSFLQNAGSTHTAEITREIMNVLTGGGQTSGSTQRARGGVNPILGLSMGVTQNGSPNMSVQVTSGHALVPGSENSKQALYSCFNDASVNKTIAAADPSLPRIDIVVAKVQDSFYSGVTNTWSIAVVTGTPASSPAVPSAPANSITLAQVLVGAGVASIVNANITDTRPWLSAAGGIVPVRNKAERDALVGPYNGLAVWRQDLFNFNVYTGSTWRYFSRLTETRVATSQATTSVTYTDLATVGPAVTIETGDSAEVNIGSWILQSTAGFTAFASFAVSGATTRAASDAEAIGISNNAIVMAGRTVVVTGLTPGNNTFTMKYRVNGNTGTYQDRSISAKAM